MSWFDLIKILNWTWIGRLTFIFLGFLGIFGVSSESKIDHLKIRQSYFFVLNWIEFFFCDCLISSLMQHVSIDSISLILITDQYHREWCVIWVWIVLLLEMWSHSDSGEQYQTECHWFQTALYWSAFFGRLEVLQLFIARGADIFVANVWFNFVWFWNQWSAVLSLDVNLCADIVTSFFGWV